MIRPNYYCNNSVQAKDLAFKINANFNIGSVLKYIQRAGRKSGESREKDLEKTLTYLQFELEAHEKYKDTPYGYLAQMFTYFYGANILTADLRMDIPTVQTITEDWGLGLNLSNALGWIMLYQTDIHKEWPLKYAMEHIRKELYGEQNGADNRAD